MRRRSHSRISHDRWLVSYADFITLLFAFFVVLYAFAKADQKKHAQVSQAIDTAFHQMGMLPGNDKRSLDASGQGREAPALPVNIVMGETPLAPAVVKDDLNRIQRDLTQTLAAQVAAHTVSIRMGRDGLVISLREAGFFNSGSAVPKPEALPTLRQIAESLGREPYDVRIEGHTDNVPIHTAGFDSNWELSTARSTRIARLLLQSNLIAPERLAAAGYAEFHPVASNNTSEGRAQNRRVDLVVMPRSHVNFAASPTLKGPWLKVTDSDPVF